MRTALAAIGISILVLVGLCFWSRRVVTYSDSNVVAGEIRSPLDAIAVHVSNPRYLTVNGRTYVGVRGLPPYYLAIPQSRLILFITVEPRKKVFFNVIDLDTKKEIRIDGDSSGFGWNIGSKRNPGEKLTDYVESVQSNKIVVATRSLNWKETTKLDLNSKSIDLVEISYYDQNNQITNHTMVRRGTHGEQ
jgi:hypothetical protein